MILPLIVVARIVGAYDDSRIKDLEDDKLKNWDCFETFQPFYMQQSVFIAQITI